ncbi:MAG: hypothetical protein ACLP8S_17310 [Solirubrobacteraceae bacterium]
MTTLTIPLSGQLLIAHLAAYGLSYTLHAQGEQAFIGHDPDSLEMAPQITTTADIEQVAERVSKTATDCEEAVEADLEPGKTGNDRRPVIWARATRADRAQQALPLREELLDHLEDNDELLPAALVAGLGAPAAWLNDRPQRGASRLDGVMGNYTSDFVRGVLRRTRPAVASITIDELRTLWTASDPPDATDDDKTGWSPPGTKAHPVHQWLAAIGLTQLPVGLAAHGSSRTPCCWRDAQTQGITLPVLSQPVSIPRLRALLQLPTLTTPAFTPAAAGRIRALGIREIVSFPVISRSTGKSVAFFFGRATRIEP